MTFNGLQARHTTNCIFPICAHLYSPLLSLRSPPCLHCAGLKPVCISAQDLTLLGGNCRRVPGCGGPKEMKCSTSCMQSHSSARQWKQQLFLAKVQSHVFSACEQGSWAWLVPSLFRMMLGESCLAESTGCHPLLMCPSPTINLLDFFLFTTYSKGLVANDNIKTISVS